MKAKQMKMTKTLLLMAALNASLTFSSAAQAQALTPDQLTLRVKNLNADSEKTAITLKMIDKELKSVKQQFGKVERLINNRAMIELSQRLDDLSAEVSQLNGMLEQQSHELSGIKKSQRELYRDTDRRLRDLESRSSQQSSGVPVEVPNLPEVSASVDVTVPDAATQADEPIADPSTSQQPDNNASGNTQSIASGVTSSEEQSAYQSAFDTLKEGRYEKAKSELKTFLQNHSDSSFAGNAQYWLGEAHYVTREFEQGIKEFMTVLSNYPLSLKIPDAMLKLGYTYYELKQYDQAVILLQDLQKRYPNSTAFRLAGKRLDRIRKEGH
jgi:tol-pal system protein YbgF